MNIFNKFFETAVVAQLNNSEIEYNENYEFTDDEKTIMSPTRSFRLFSS